MLALIRAKVIMLDEQPTEATIRAAENGDIQAQIALGDWFSKWDNDPARFAPLQAVEWLERAASAGSVEAMWKLAQLFGTYEVTEQVADAEARAYHWYRQSADRGNRNAQLALAYRLQLQAPDEARGWAFAAAERGSGDAMYLLFEAYSEGDGVPRDELEAFKWLSLASSHGERDAWKKRPEWKRRFTREERLSVQERIVEWQERHPPTGDVPGVITDGELNVIPEGLSPVRFITSKAWGKPFEPLQSLAEARACPKGYVIMEGDSGGQIYLTCPASMVNCSEAVLRQLLEDIDDLEWACNLGYGSGLYFERHSPGDGIAGGMGGGMTTEDLWVHEDLEERGLTERIRGVLHGRWALLPLLSQDELRRDAELGDAIAQYELGLQAQSDAYESKDYRPAVQWFERAAEQGHSGAQHLLSFVLAREDPKDVARALMWEMKLALNPNITRRVARMRYRLGLKFDRGWEVPVDKEEAVRWYLLAADAGDVDACTVLGQKFLDGEGVSQDPETARSWFQRAADWGDRDGMFELGLMLLEGTGGPCDTEAAIAWLESACRCWNDAACLKLAEVFSSGIACEVDSVEALKWYLVADSKDEEAEAKEMNLRGALLESEIEEAKRRADEFLRHR